VTLPARIRHQPFNSRYKLPLALVIAAIPVLLVQTWVGAYWHYLAIHVPSHNAAFAIHQSALDITEVKH